MKNILKLAILLALFTTNSQAAYNPLGSPVGSFQVNGGNQTLVGASNSTAAQTALNNIQGNSPLYVTNYGAKCNAKTLTDATTAATSGSVFDSAFSSADVGKQIAVYAGTPISTTGNTHTSLTIDNLGTTTGVAIGQVVIGSGVRPLTYVTAINSSTSVQVSIATSSTLTATAIKFVPIINDTVASFSTSGGNHIVLTTNTAGVTISGAAIVNYGTDDSTAINSAITAAGNAGGGTVVLPVASCAIASPVVMASKVSLIGRGQNASGLKWLSTHSLGSGYEGGIVGNLSGNSGSLFYDNTIADLELDMDASFTSSYQYYNKCIDMTFLVRPTFKNLYMHGSPATCLGVDYVSQMTVKDNTIVNAGRSQTTIGQDGNCMAFEIGGGSIPNMESSIISGNHCINPHHYGIEIESISGASNIPVIVVGNEINTNQNNTIGIEDNGGTGSVIIGNTLVSTAAAPVGFGLSNRGGPIATYNGTYGRMANNTIQGFRDCVSFLPNTTGTPYGNYTIENNTCWNPARYGIVLFGASSDVINSMSILHNTISGAQNAGIAVIAGGSNSTFNNLTISGNMLESNGAGTSGVNAAGIYIGQTVVGLKMTDNYAWDDGNGYQKYGFALDSTGTVTNGLDSLNHFNNNATGAEDIVGSWTGQQWNVYGVSGSYPLTSSGTATLTNKTYDTAGTGNVFKINGTSITSISGNAAKLATATGTLTSGDCVQFDVSGNLVDAGAACGGGGGSGTVSSATAGQMTYYSGTGTTVVGNPNVTYSTGALTLGVATTQQGSLKLAGSTSGTTTLAAQTSGGGTMTLQAGTDTLVGKATTDTFTNKTFDTAGTGNSFKINGTGITAISGNTAKVATASGTLTNGDCVSIDASGNFVDAGGACTVGGGGGTVNAGTSGQMSYYASSTNAVSGNANATISSGTLTLGQATSVLGSLKLSGSTSGTTTISPAVAASGTLTLPAATDTLVGKATTDTLTNKTISGASNTLSAIATGSLATVQGNGTKVQLSTSTTTTNDCVKFDANGNTVDAGAACGTGSGTVNSGTSGNFAYYASSSTAVSTNSTFTTTTVPRLNAAGTFTAGQAVSPSTVSISTSTFTPDLSASNNFAITLVHASCPCTLANPSNPVAGQSGVIVINQSATGSDLVSSYGTSWKFAAATPPALTSTASAVDVFSYYVIDTTHILLSPGVLNVH